MHDTSYTAVVQYKDLFGRLTTCCGCMQDDLERLGQPPSEEDFDGWPDAPLLLRSAPLPYQQLEQSADPCAIRVNDSR